VRWNERQHRSGRLQDGEHGHGPAQEEKSVVGGGNVLVAAGTKAEEVAEFVVGSAEPRC
jgi:hypothetical protein